jgi:acetyltransferase-like isoleucine patch superfamily enzyme
MQKFNCLLTTLVVLLLPKWMKPYLLRLLGHSVSSSCSIGFNLIKVEKLCLDEHTSIGHFNYINCRRLVMREKSYIDHFNKIRGPLSVWLKSEAAIGRRNDIYRAPKQVSFGSAHLKLGVLSKITSSHTVDCMASVSFGNFCTLAGARSQLWSHGYYHYPVGPDRFRVDGRIRIGNNVYIGSATVITMGVRVADSVIIGSHSSVARNLDKPGLYVSQPLRFIATDIEQTIKNLIVVESAELVEKVYLKK